MLYRLSLRSKRAFWLIGIFGGCGLLMLLAQGCGRVEDPWKDKAGPPRVVASFAPLNCFALNVAGDHAGVICICTSKGPHDYELNPIHDLVPLRTANLLLINGMGLEENFAKRLQDSSGNRNLKVVEVAEVAFAGDKESMLLQLPGGDQGNDEHGHHHHGSHDPHVWMGIPQAIEMVKVIRDELKEADKKNADDYDRNAAAYIKKLDALYDEGKAALKSPDGKHLRVISNHESLGYFAKAFGLEVVGYLESSGHEGEEPAATKLEELTLVAKENPVQVIAVEPQYGRGPADALLSHMKSKGVALPKVVEIDPLETATPSDLQDRDWYENKIRANIDRLKKCMP